MRDFLDVPGFSKQEFGQTVLLERLPVDKMVLHSTEGSNWPGYGGGYRAPHATIDPRKREVRQHIPFSQAGYALVAPADGTHTNTGGAVQIEIIGSCVVNSPLPSVLNFNEDELGYLALVLKDTSDATGIPLVSNVQWFSYPASYGKSPVRLTSKQWYDYNGVLGHQHVPGNLHGDPGALNVARILEIANSTTQEIPDMDASQIAALDEARNAAKQAVTIATENNRLLGVILGWQPPQGPEAAALGKLYDNDLPTVTVDTAALAAQIVAAIPANLASQVADLLGKRLSNG